MKPHELITKSVLEAAVLRRVSYLDGPGFCKACGCEQGGCEPEAADYECKSCGAHEVFGAEDILRDFENAENDHAGKI